MSKELYMNAHEALIEEYLEAHPDADWTEAYEATADGAHDRMTDRMADMADYYRQRRKDGVDPNLIDLPSAVREGQD